MRSITRAGAGNAVADLKTVDAFADGNDSPGGAVAESLDLIEFGGGLFVSSAQPFAFEGVEDLTHKVRAAAGFAEQRALRRLHDHSLGTGADEGMCGSHQQAACFKRG